MGGGGEGGGSVGGGDGGVGGGEGTAGGKAGGGLSHFSSGVVAPANMKTRPELRQQSTERVTLSR
eukprot:scaffold109846_cov18-Phaeocystis_antarctica.AAC.1